MLLRSYVLIPHNSIEPSFVKAGPRHIGWVAVGAVLRSGTRASQSPSSTTGLLAWRIIVGYRVFFTRLMEFQVESDMEAGCSSGL